MKTAAIVIPGFLFLLVLGMHLLAPTSGSHVAVYTAGVAGVFLGWLMHKS